MFKMKINNLKIITIFFVLLSTVIIAQSNDEKTMYISANSGLNFRINPSIKSKSICVIPFGAAVSIEEIKKKNVVINGKVGKWCEIKFNDKFGWVFGYYLVSAKKLLSLKGGILGDYVLLETWMGSGNVMCFALYKNNTYRFFGSFEGKVYSNVKGEFKLYKNKVFLQKPINKEFSIVVKKNIIYLKGIRTFRRDENLGLKKYLVNKS